jgi:uncharacterized protein YbcI
LECEVDRPGSSARVQQDVSEVLLETQGEMEAAISRFISRFSQEYLGRGPKNIRTYLLGDLVVVRMQGVLTAPEQQLAKSFPTEKGRDLLKQVRSHLIETVRPQLNEFVLEATGVRVVSLHHDISTKTGEEIVIFTLAGSVSCRAVKSR